MKIKEETIWQLISQFPFDAPNAIQNFPARVAVIAKWSPEYTDLVLCEYKRFLYLCAISNELLVPPEAIDLTWCVHMEFYPSSFRDLTSLMPAKHIVRRSRGSEIDETDHHELPDAFLSTLKLYHEIFEDHPPADIWNGYENMNNRPRPVNIRVGSIINVTLDARWVVVFLIILGFIAGGIIGHPLAFIGCLLPGIVFAATHPALNDDIAQVRHGKGYRGRIH